VQDTYHLICSDPVTTLDEAAGTRIRIGGEAWANEAEAIGASPVTLSGAEMYEGFQRGIVDCYMGPPPDMSSLGLWDIGQEYTEGTFTGFTSYGLPISLEFWNSLDAPAQDLLWDSQEVYFRRLAQNNIQEHYDFYTTGPDHGLTFHEFDAETLATVEEHQQGVLDTLAADAPPDVTDPEALIERYLELHEKWHTIVIDLGYESDEETWAEWAEARPDGPEVELDPWIQAVVDEILNPHRPY
jgi:TRAP-type C4-dicarboxylate transport system substrate-binding protein